VTTTTDTQQERLMRAFETLKKLDITPILMLTGSTGEQERNWEEYRIVARAADTPDAWVGAHVGAEVCGYGGHWVDGRLCFRATGHLVSWLWFSYSDPVIGNELAAAVEEQGFHIRRVGDEVHLLLQEED
jgi:hypothetical protein